MTSHDDHVLRMWTVYDHPTDFPEAYVARMCEVRRERGAKGFVTNVVATPNILISSDLETLRTILGIEMQLTRLQRYKDDEPQIVEVWV